MVVAHKLLIDFYFEAIDLVVEETNQYASQCRCEWYECSSLAPHPWHDITRDKVKAFFGMLFLYGNSWLPQLELYWSTKHDLVRQHIPVYLMLCL